jgi:hypothetical protein
MFVETKDLAARVQDRLLERNRLCEDFFEREAGRLALARRGMSERLLQAGRPLAFGRGPWFWRWLGRGFGRILSC